MKKNKVLIIAEIGPNHNGSFQKAKKMIKEISKIGVDFVKFQLGDPKKVYSSESIMADYQKKNDKKIKSIEKMSQKNQLSLSEHVKLYKYCKKLNLKYSCSAFDLKSLKDLNERVSLPFFKIPSGEINSLDILEYISKQNKKIILSTGMSSLLEIKNAVNILNRHKKKDITLLHCISAYPAKHEMVNLNFMNILEKKFNCKIGFSDHTLTELSALAAVAKGARVIEKHITTSKKLIGPDHKSSFTIKEFKYLIKKIRQLELILGDGKRFFSKEELNVKKVSRKSIVAAKEIKKGKKITISDIVFKRPGTGISPLKFKEIIGKRTMKTLHPNTIIKKFFLR
jgi:N,N'-diacetyllegionaminate synthase